MANTAVMLTTMNGLRSFIVFAKFPKDDKNSLIQIIWDKQNNLNCSDQYCLVIVKAEISPLSWRA
jgi:hypothetical protein